MSHSEAGAPPSAPFRRRFGAFELDVTSGELFDRGRKVRLQDQPFKILARLTREPGQVVTREELKRELWPDDTFVDFEHGLNEAVNRLRRALRDSADRPRFIETLPKRGYRFVAQVDAVPPPEAIAARHESSPSAPDPPPATPVPPLTESFPLPPADSSWMRTHRSWLAAALLTALVGAATWAGWSRDDGPRSEVAALAVLPFANLSSDRAYDYLADGFTEELTTALAGIGGPRVTSRTSAMRYKDTVPPLADVAATLRVDAVVEGSVRVADGRVRVTAQLVRTASDDTLWTGNYERPLADVLALQRDVASAIAGELRMELRTGPPAAAPATDALLASMKGRYQLNRRTPDAFTSAAEFFRQAIAIDPSYAAAHAGLAETLALMAIYNVAPPHDVMPRAKAAARQALTLSPGLASAQVTLAWTAFMYDWDWKAADAAFQAALAADPSSVTAHQSYGVFLTAMARHDEAVRAIQRALALDPLSLSAADSLGWVWYTRGDHARARQQYRQLLALDPTFGLAHRFLGLVELQAGNHDVARAELERAATLLGTSTEPETDLAIAFAAAGDRVRAQAALDRLLAARASGRYVAALLLSGLYESLGRRPDALAELERAEEERTSTLVMIAVDPLFSAMRAEPRFQQVVAHIGLPQPGR